MWYLLLLPLVLTLNMKEPELPPGISTRNAQEGWITAKLNQFDASNTDTFQMRYYYNPAPATTNNIVIFVGGEWSISAGWVTAGLPYEFAEQIGAAIFYTEHRYYGLTRPTNDTSVDNLKYLTVDQALADLAQFVEFVRSDQFESGRYKDGKVALFGCSYSGSMATWARLVSPHLITAAMSDSGPLQAQDDFPEYLEVVAEALRVQGGEQCITSVEEAMKGLVAKLDQAGGPAEVAEMFNTCGPLNAASPLDRATFFWYGVTEAFAYLVQYATPGDIPKACEVLTDAAVGDPVQRLANWIKSSRCIETSYEQVVTNHNKLSFDSEDSVMRLWTYQTCVEYGWFQTTTGSNHPFLDVVPLEYFHQMCEDFFGNDFNSRRVDRGVSRTNLLFGGKAVYDHVVTVQGSHDPWSPMAPNSTHSSELAPVYVVEGTSHCQGTRPLGSSDNPELEATKQRVLDHMTYFMTGERPPVDHGFANQTIANILLLIVTIFLTM